MPLIDSPALSHATNAGEVRIDRMRNSRSEIVRAIEDAGSTVRGSKCHCPHPDHEDRNPSASIFEGERGYRWKCQGCGRGGDVFDVIAYNEGTTPGEVMRRVRSGGIAPQEPSRSKPRPKRAEQKYPSYDAAAEAIGSRLHGFKMTGRWRYRDQRGEDYAEVIRFDQGENKTFRPASKNCTGIVTRDPERWLPYRVNELDSTTPFVVAEGEKAADALWSVGIPATTSAHGSKSASKTDWSCCNGRAIYIWPDKDDGGKQYADDVAHLAYEAGAESVHLISPPEELPATGDAFNYIEARDAQESEAIQRSIHRLMEGAVRAPREGEATTTAPKAGAQQEASQGATGQSGKHLIIRKASEIQTKPIEWFYDQRIPANSMSLVIGMPNCGKSTLLMDWAARVSNGSPWPVGGGNAPKGSVLILSAEDQPEHIIVPRLQAAGADLDKIAIVEGVSQMRTSEGKSVRTGVDVGRDADVLEAYIEQLGDVKLIIIDPLDSYIGSDTDVFRGNEARAALEPLKVLAEQRGVTVLICHHFNKAPTTNAMDRVSGARSFGALPRSVWVAAADETDKESNRSILAPAKWNMSRSRPSAMGYSMRSSRHNPEVACIAWESGELDVSVNDLMSELSAERESDSIREAKEFIASVLALGETNKAEVKQRACEAGISSKSLDAAARKLKVIKRDVRDDRGRVTQWLWSMP